MTGNCVKTDPKLTQATLGTKDLKPRWCNKKFKTNATNYKMTNRNN